MHCLLSYINISETRNEKKISHYLDDPSGKNVIYKYQSIFYYLLKVVILTHGQPMKCSKM